MDFEDTLIALYDEAPLCFIDPWEWAEQEAQRRVEAEIDYYHET